MFHSIFDKDLDLITALTFWGGPCYPNPYGMMNCRLKSPCLARALRTTKYGAPRGMIDQDITINVAKDTVAKWGNWHCGENKDKFRGQWSSANTSVLEPYFEGQAVRVVVVGTQHLQIKMDGQQWLKSIHHDGAEIMEVDPGLLEDTLNLKAAFELEMIANDYIIAASGDKFLLEVNHIPNMTRFPEMTHMYLEEVQQWIKESILS